MKTNLRIGEVLMERGCITQEQMEQALAYQKEHREKRVGQILIELGFITETHVLEALAARLGLEIVSIGQMRVDLAAVRLIPRELAEKQNLLAVRASEGSLEIVTNDQLNYFAFEEVRQLTGCHVVIRLSELGPLQSAIRYYYAEVGAQQAAQTANEGFAGSDAELVRIEESESGDPEAPIVKLLNSLLDRAISTYADKAGATVKADGKAAVITPEVNEVVVKSARNLPGVTTAPAKLINVYDLLNAKTLVIDKEALVVIEEVFA